MEKVDKFIKIACLLAFIIVVLALVWFFYINSGFSGIKADTGNSVKQEPAVKLLFVGDIMLDRHVGEKIKAQGFDYLFKGLIDGKFDFNKYEIINANLEGSVTDNGSHYPPALENDFAFSPEAMDKLKNYNFTSFNLANNHLADQGERGINETRSNLGKLKINYYGCNDGQAGDCSTKVYQLGNFKIGVAGFSMVYKKFDLEKAKQIIKNLKTEADLVVVNLHRGTEYSHNFNKTQTAVAHGLIDAGADLIIGHHPHVVQGVELYKNKPIFYSLGNFIFDQYFSPETQEELAVELEFLPSGQTKFSLIPMKSKLSQPSLMTGLDKAKYLGEIAGWSKGDENLLEQIRSGEILLNN